MRLKLTFNSVKGRKEINRLRHRAKSMFLLSGREPYFSCLQNVGLKEKSGPRYSHFTQAYEFLHRN